MKIIKNKIKIKYIILCLSIILLSVLSMRYFVFSANSSLQSGDTTQFGARLVKRSALSESASSVGTITEIDIKPYTYKEPLYKKIDIFPINKDVFNSCGDFFCAQHNTPYGSSTRPTNLGKAGHDYHHSNQITSHKISSSITLTKEQANDYAYIMKLDVPNAKPRVYLDVDVSSKVVRRYLDGTDKGIVSTGNSSNAVLSPLGTYKGYRDNEDDAENSSSKIINEVYTNWIYIPQDVKFDCCTYKDQQIKTAGTGVFSNGAYAFVLAAHKGKYHANGTYSLDPLQHTTWDWLGQGGGSAYQKMGKEFDKYHEDSDKPNVDIRPYGDNAGEEAVGTILGTGEGDSFNPDEAGTTYHVGPFEMSDYVRAADYKYTIPAGITYTVLSNESIEANNEAVKNGEAICVDDNVYITYTTTGEQEIILQDSFTNAEGRDSSLWETGTKSENDLRGTIIGMELVLSNGTNTKNYTVVDYKNRNDPNIDKIPEPGEKDYYIDIPESVLIDGYDELLDIKFIYQRVHASGAGTWYEGLQEKVKFQGWSDDQQSTCTYNCETCSHTGLPYSGTNYNQRSVEGPHYKWCLGSGYCEHGYTLHYHCHNGFSNAYCNCTGTLNSGWVNNPCPGHPEGESCSGHGGYYTYHTHTSSCDCTPASTPYCSHNYLDGKHEPGNGGNLVGSSSYELCYGTTRCNHGHETCRYFTWDDSAESGGDMNQDAIASAGLLSTEIREYTIRVSVPLKTQMSITKYISHVSHQETGSDTPYFDGSARKDKSMQDNYNDSVKVERGDLVEYTIEVENKSRFDTEVKMRDILPQNYKLAYLANEVTGTLDDCTIEQLDTNIQASKWTSIPAKSSKTYIVKIRPIQPDGEHAALHGMYEGTLGLLTPDNPDEKYTNIIEFLSTNAGREDVNSHEKLYMKYTLWGNNATHGTREHGNIVNTIENKIIDPTALKPKQIDSDTYEIKQYNVNIEKYIYDVNHEEEYLATSGLDTSLVATDDRSKLNGMDEDTKKANPVYAEYGDTVTYKIKVYNTTNTYDSSIDRTQKPYWEPDKVYVNIEDTLPKKCKDIKVTVDNGTGAISDLSDGVSKFTITNMMVPPDGVTTVTVTLVVDEHTKGTVEENNAKFIDEIRNINKKPGNENNVDDKFCVIKNNPILTNTSDFYKINNYNAFIDKYVYKYDEKIHNENNSLLFTNEDSITNPDGTLKTLRENTNITYTTVSDGNVDDKVRVKDDTDDYKKEHPVSVDKEELITYRIKVINEAESVSKSVATGNKPATQVRPKEVTDRMQIGLEQKKVTATVYNKDGSICSRYMPFTPGISGPTRDGIFNVYKYTINDNNIILNPGEYIIYEVTVLVTESDLYLYSLENNAELTILTNINDVTNKKHEVKNATYNENISEQQSSSDFVRMKDLVIAGKVWLDFNKNGLMDDTITDYVEQTEVSNGGNLYRTNPDKLKTYHDINENAMMNGIVVKLYKEDGTLVKTTKTDGNGLFTFSRNDSLVWFASGYNHDIPYSSGTVYQRIDKATGKDSNGNYTTGSQYINYYIEYEYDGVIYKATAYSGKDHLNTDGSYKGSDCGHSFETNTSGYATDDYKKESKPNDKYKYEYDSNANEFVSVRETFNTKYQYFTYNQAYSTSKTSEIGGTLEFDKTDHTSQLLVDHRRAMTARSFIETIAQPNTQEATNYIALFGYSDSNVTIPYSRYLKFINLGLELREDVDISLTKDVYKVKTTIKGEEMEYNFNTNFIINGDVLNENVLNNYMLNKAYGIELYESDYKYRNEQYSSIRAVQEYLSEQSELNVEVTYRIRINNNQVHIDDDLVDPESLTGSYDKKNFADTDKTKLYVKVDEILDLYDENFIEFTSDMEGNEDKGTIKVRELDPKTGRFKAEDKKIKIAEAWYYKKDDSGEYVLDDESQIYINTQKENIDATGLQRYARVDLKVSNTPIGKDNEYLVTGKYTDEGYHKLYISGMGDEKIQENEHLDIFAKYVLDKGDEEITVQNESFAETATQESATLYSDVSYDPMTDTISWSGGSTTLGTTNTSFTTNMIRSLIIKDHKEGSKLNCLGTENIAQINYYSVWYAYNDKETSIVDKDSNAGNVGINNDKQVDSIDNKSIYEDNVYKTGIEIMAEGTANEYDNTKVEEIIPQGYSGEKQIKRIMNGHVWDDSRSETVGGAQAQFIGNGLRYINTEDAINEAKKNELVPIVKSGETEETDIPVSSARVEFIEIVETAPNTYYEINATDVTSDYVQHIRTDADGAYELKGYTPGKYVVRFTYGDDIEGKRASGLIEQTNTGVQANQEDMYLFNGQDYKSTKYTTPDLSKDATGNTVLDDKVVLYNYEDISGSDKAIIDANNIKIDNVIAALEEKDYNDARDDEIRRLEANGYSEIMDNMMAEILQGIANGRPYTDGGEVKYLTNNNHANSNVELQALVDNTYMIAETIPFTVRAEKINDQLKAAVTALVQDPTYANRMQLEKELEQMRDFKIENIDFGIEYRPENSVQLEKDIKEVKITTESGEEVVDLHFYTKYYDENNLPTNGTVKEHFLDMEKSVGLEMIQFISNEYNRNNLVSLISENQDQLQGFVYINYDVDIQQGATIEVTYEFIAENHGEVDRIAKNLDDIRYQNNAKTQSAELVGAITSNILSNAENQNGVTNYKANITAANDMINNLYNRDTNNDIFRTSPKVLTRESGERVPATTVNADGASRNTLSYYGYYVGYEFYTGKVTDFDTVAQLKFNKILDYVDKDMLYSDNTTGKESVNKTWSVLDNDYEKYYSTIDWARSDIPYVTGIAGNGITAGNVQDYIDQKIQSRDVKSVYSSIKNTNGLTTAPTANLTLGKIYGASIDPDGYIYENMLISTDTGMYTDTYDSSRNLMAQADAPGGTNPSMSRFLLPMSADTSVDASGNNSYDASRGKIDLIVSKAISAETNDDELEYENIAEIVEFTTLTGRRTNFAITIGNVDLRKRDLDPTNPTPSPDEYPQATPEPDQSAAEVITLIPPQGLMKRDRVIREVVEIAKKGTGIVGAVVAVAVIAVSVTTFGIRKYRKRRIK